MPCYHDRARCRRSSYYEHTRWAHNPQFHKIETWHSCTPLLLRLFLTLGSIRKSRATFWEAIYSGIRRNTYSHCSEPLSPSVSGNERLPTRLKLLIAPSYLALDDFLEFQLKRCLYATFTEIAPMYLSCFELHPSRVFPITPHLKSRDEISCSGGDL